MMRCSFSSWSTFLSFYYAILKLCVYFAPIVMCSPLFFSSFSSDSVMRFFFFFFRSSSLDRVDKSHSLLFFFSSSSLDSSAASRCYVKGCVGVDVRRHIMSKEKLFSYRAKFLNTTSYFYPVLSIKNLSFFNIQFLWFVLFLLYTDKYHVVGS